MADDKYHTASGSYSLAEQRLTEALEKIQSLNTDVLADKWEPLLNNLAHTCRKLKKYEEALEYHRQALIIRPQNPTTLSGIGFVYALQGKYDNAIDYLHRALGLRRDDTFATTMLTYCIETHMAEAEPITGMTEGESFFNYNGTLESSHTELKAEDSMLDSSRGQDTSNLLEESSGLESEDQNVSMSMDSSGMALDTDMEDA